MLAAHTRKSVDNTYLTKKSWPGNGTLEIAIAAQETDFFPVFGQGDFLQFGFVLSPIEVYIFDIHMAYVCIYT